MVSVSNKSSSSGMGWFVSATLRTRSWPPPCMQQQRDEHGDVMCLLEKSIQMAVCALSAHHTGRRVLSRYQRMLSALSMHSAALEVLRRNHWGYVPRLTKVGAPAWPSWLPA